MRQSNLTKKLYEYLLFELNLCVGIKCLLFGIHYPENPEDFVPEEAF